MPIRLEMHAARSRVWFSVQIMQPARLPLVLVLAAGRGERFAASGATTHKLDALLGGTPVLEHVLNAVRDSGLECHVVRAAAVVAHSGLPGMGDSIAAGVAATPNLRGWMVLPGDLPLVRAETLRAIAMAPPCAVLVPTHQGKRGHPVRFSAECGAALQGLNGDQGAARIVKEQQALGAVQFMELQDAGVVTDVDTLHDLQRAQALWNQRR
jgi:molybdenum cofactor cytidylyltransferase